MSSVTRSLPWRNVTLSSSTHCPVSRSRMSTTPMEPGYHRQSKPCPRDVVTMNGEKTLAFANTGCIRAAAM